MSEASQVAIAAADNDEDREFIEANIRAYDNIDKFEERNDQKEELAG